jgi:hypothetical protein
MQFFVDESSRSRLTLAFALVLTLPPDILRAKVDNAGRQSQLLEHPSTRKQRPFSFYYGNHVAVWIRKRTADT